MRESAILGILGIYTLGHFIDSAISEDQLDKALVLIIITALLNMGIDTLSQRIQEESEDFGSFCRPVIDLTCIDYLLRLIG